MRTECIKGSEGSAESLVGIQIISEICILAPGYIIQPSTQSQTSRSRGVLQVSWIQDTLSNLVLDQQILIQRSSAGQLDPGYNIQPSLDQQIQRSSVGQLDPVYIIQPSLDQQIQRSTVGQLDPVYIIQPSFRLVDLEEYCRLVGSSVYYPTQFQTSRFRGVLQVSWIQDTTS